MAFSLFSAAQFGAFHPLDRSHLPPASVSLSRRRCAAVKPLNAEPKRSDSIVPSAATVVAPGTLKKKSFKSVHADLLKKVLII